MLKVGVEKVHRKGKDVSYSRFDKVSRNIEVQWENRSLKLAVTKMG